MQAYLYRFMADNTFKTGERLKSRHEIDRLFAGKSQSFSQYPLRLVWCEMEYVRSDFPIQLAISVPKRRFKKAVDRNKIRRLVRESYRLRKYDLYAQLPAESPQMAWMIIYVGKKKEDFLTIDKTMAKLMNRFLKKTKKQTT